MPSYNGIFFTDQGQGDRPLVLVHGFCCDHTDWDAIVQPLSARHRILAVDLRGHGQSDSGAGSIETFAEDIADLVEAESLDTAVLVGHSLGCRVVLAASERLRGHLGGLVLVDGSRTTGDISDLATMRAKIESLGFRSFASNMFQQMFTDKADAQTIERVVNRAAEKDGAWALDLWQSLGAWDIERMDEVVRHTPEPVLAIQTTLFEPGKERFPLADEQQTPYTEFLQSRFVHPDSNVAIIANTGHFPQFEEPSRLVDLLDDFVSR